MNGKVVALLANTENLRRNVNERRQFMEMYAYNQKETIGG